MIAEGSGDVRLHVFASGSKGNCSVVENSATGALVVIDCGISKRAFMESCAACGLDPARVEAVLVTHEHSDHVKGLGVLTRGLARLGAHPALYASAAVHAASPDICSIQDAVDLRHFKAGDDLNVGGMRVRPFATSHDAAESFGFRFESAADAIGFMTDTGFVTQEAHEALQGCRVLAIEANHDVDMLAKGPYPYYLKARVGGDRGHLSNDQSAELLESLLCNELQQVIGMHVSQNNNTYALPPLTLGDVLGRNSHPAQAHVGYQARIVSVG